MRKEKEIQTECEGQIKDVRSRLDQQIKSLDQKMESQVGAIMEMQEFFKRRGEIEQEYSQKLDKLSKTYFAKQKTEKQRRDMGQTFLSSHNCLNSLIQITKHQSRDHNILAEIYTNSMNNRFNDIIDDHRRIYSKSKEIALASHEEISKVLNELLAEMKQYHVSNTTALESDAKLKHTEEQKAKVAAQANAASKKLKTLEQQCEKQKEVYNDCKREADKARNNYLLAVSAVNAAAKKYFDEDLPLIIDCMDFGYHNAVQRAMLQYVSCLESLRTSHKTHKDTVNKCVQELDSNADKQVYLKDHSSLYSLPKPFTFQPHRGDEMSHISIADSLQDDLVNRHQQLQHRLSELKIENEEAWKSVETVDKTLIDMLNVKDYDVADFFKPDASLPKIINNVEMKKKRSETEDYYLQKFKKYVIDSNLIVRLHAKHKEIKTALGDDLLKQASNTATLPRPMSTIRVKPKRIGKSPVVGQPKVFGCDLEEYIQVTGEAIPRVVESCIRSINKYGMHHEGVFRVSGLHAEINDLKAVFERGEDALADLGDGNCINAVAGTLKSFFRDLQEPIFPMHMFDDFISAVRTDATAKQTLKALIYSLSKARIVVMRYLFAFLNHLTQYSDENLMHPYNLAVCFGPCLLPIPKEKDQVAYQSNVNDIIKIIIECHDTIFDKNEPPGPLYQRILESGKGAKADEELSEEEAEVIEAVAAYDFEGRSGRELSFKKGQTLILYNQASADWWEGACDKKEGLIPDKYIQLKSSARVSITSLGQV